MNFFECTRDLTLQLVRFPSVTGTSGETQFAHFLHSVLAGWDYFARNPHDLWLLRTRDDAHERYIVFGLVRGDGERTTVLTGHYDVVSTSNYGALEHLAFEPELLLPALIQKLQHDGSNPNALRDLQSGDYMAGRATLDMKSGLAAGLAVLQKFSQQATRVGNLLFAAVPDEEENSNGMRTLVSVLADVARERHLSIEAAINLDSGVNLTSDDDGRAVYLGSVGKLLPSVFFVGRPTHVGAPFDGVNASLLAAELTRLVECSIDVGDAGTSSPAPPPVNLYQTDRRTRYDVTTPATAWCAYNVLTHHRKPNEVLHSFAGLAEQAIANALELIRSRTHQFAAATQTQLPMRMWQKTVLTFAQLREKLGETAVAKIQAALAAHSGLSNMDYCQRLIEAMVREATLEGPAAIVCFASMYYPAVHLGESPREQRLRQACVQHAQQLSQETGAHIYIQPFFEGISDMSFVASTETEASIQAITQNTPTWHTRLNFDYSAAATLNLPIVNIGPWGQDYHQNTERVHMPYSFGVVPELVWRVAMQVNAG